MIVPFTEADLRRLAPPRSFERGLSYVGSVSSIDVARDGATATVYGSDEYQVCLTWAGGVPDGACTCPHGEEGFFCKHCVALGLTLLQMDLGNLVKAAKTKRGAIEDWVRALSREQLVVESHELRQRYELRVTEACWIMRVASAPPRRPFAHAVLARRALPYPPLV
jgi:uncharacterized Zn finger protein